jgi:hypothetical protein
LKAVTANASATAHGYVLIKLYLETGAGQDLAVEIDKWILKYM